MATRVIDDSPLTGSLIAGRYTLGEPLGSGGVAVVWRGWDTHTERAVALKSARVDGWNDVDGSQIGRQIGAPSGRAADAPSLATLRWRIAREGQIMASLTHPHIARVYDYVEVAGRPWLALELVEGPDLLRATSERGPLSALAALDVGHQICAALAAIHAVGIIHRDIKPRNIILSSGGHATLIDFDLAWTPILRDEGEPDMVYGTPEYMAPEQAMGERITAATDLYSLGVTLYELLAGKAPFHSSSASAIMWRHVTEAPPPLREWRHDLPAPVERAVMRALAKEPRRRYPSAEAMGRALAQAAETARQTAPAYHAWWPLPPVPAPNAAVTRAPVPTVGRPKPAPTPPSPGQAASDSGRWLMLTFWALALICVTLTLILLSILAQRLPT